MENVIAYNTFDEVCKGDLVIRRGPNEADVRFIEGIYRKKDLSLIAFPDDQVNILLVNGYKDLSYDGENGIEQFNKDWRLLVKKENLVEE